MLLILATSLWQRSDSIVSWWSNKVTSNKAGLKYISLFSFNIFYFLEKHYSFKNIEAQFEQCILVSELYFPNMLIALHKLLRIQ